MILGIAEVCRLADFHDVSNFWKFAHYRFHGVWAFLSGVPGSVLDNTNISLQKEGSSW